MKIKERIHRDLSVLLVISLSFMAMSAYIKTSIPQEKYLSVATESLPKTVTIYVTYGRKDPVTGQHQQRGILGSGVFVSPNGHMLSCAHLFTLPYNIDSITVEANNGYVYPAILILKDKKRDLSLIKINAITPYAVLNKYSFCKTGTRSCSNWCSSRIKWNCDNRSY